MVVSCWLFLYDLYYDARNHEHPVDASKYTAPLKATVLYKQSLSRILNGTT